MIERLKGRISEWLGVDPIRTVLQGVTVELTRFLDRIRACESKVERLEKASDAMWPNLSAAVVKSDSIACNALSRIEALASRLDAIEAGGKGDTWASFIAEGGSIVGVECWGDYEPRVAREVRVVAIAGPMAAIQAAAVARRIFGGEAAVVVPPDSAIERPQG